MNKIIRKSLILLAIISLLAVSVFAARTYTLAEESVVDTDRGLISIHPGTLINGNPEDYAILSVDTELNTEEKGPMWFDAGTEIDCTPAPGYPDNCNPL